MTEIDLAALELSPRLHDDPVVYTTVPRGYDTSEAFATVAEPEGLTVVLPQDDADDAGLAYEYVGAWITLLARTPLDGVGLTAAVSRVLAADAISCNMVAGFFHDHLVVPWDRRHDALRLLDGLGSGAERE